MKHSPARDFERQRLLAAALPAATEDIKWGADLVYSVGGRMFCIFLLDGKRPTTCSFKVNTDRFLELTGLPGVEPAPYLARAHWVQLRPGHALAADDLDSLICRSHALVVARLTRKLRSELGLQ